MIRPRHDLSLEQALVPPLIWAATLTYYAAPKPNPALAGVAFALAVFCALTRNTAMIGAAMAASSLGFRWFYRSADFGDQQWVQWFSISMPMAGLNPFEATDYNRMSWAAYLPAGDWYGGLFMAMGLHEYWLVWGAVITAIYAIPLLVFRNYASLIAFSLLSHFHPLLGYTASGGNLEPGAAMLLLTVWLIRCGQFSAAAACGAFAVMTRQTTALVAPFLLLALWRAGARRQASAMVALCLAGGGFFLLMNPAAVAEGVRFHLSLSADKWLTKPGDLHSAFTLGGLAYGLGAPAEFVMQAMRPYYLPAAILLWLALLGRAWRMSSPERILLSGCTAQIGVYFLGRYGLAPYLPSAALPMAAFLLPAGIWPGSRTPARILTGGVITICLTVMLAPPLLWAVAKLTPQPDGRMVPIAETAELDGAKQHVRLIDLAGRQPGLEIPIDHSLEIRLTKTVTPRAIRFVGPECAYLEDHGVKMWWVPTLMELTPVELEIWRGAERVTSWNIAPTLNAYPLTFTLPAMPATDRLRIVCRRAHRSYPKWTLSHVEILE